VTGADIDALTGQAALVVTAAAVVLGVLVWLRTRAWSPAMPVFLELLLAAGLLRLGASDDWHAIGAAAAIVAIRALVKAAAGHSAHGLGPSEPTRHEAA
jgi:hypothetical protein